LRTGLATLLTGGALLVPCLAGAQIAPLPERTFQTPERSVVLTVSQDLFYDTNVSRGSDAGAALRGIKNEDVRAAPTATLNMVLPRGRALFTVQGSAGYDAYARNQSLNRERLSIRTESQVPLAFCSIAPELAYSRRQIDLIDVGATDGVIVAAGRNVQLVKEALGAVTCGPQFGLRPGGHIGYVNTRTDTRIARQQEVRETSYGSALNYVHPSVGIIALFARRRDVTYDRERQFFPGRLSSVSITNAGLRMDRRLGTRLQLVASLSYADLASAVNPPGAKNFDGVNWDFSATLRLGGRLLLTTETDRMITISPGFSAETVRQTNYAGSLNYALTPLVQVTASVSRADRDFRLAPRSAFGITRDRFDTAAVRLNYTKRQVTFSLRGSYQRRDSDNDLFDFKGAQALLSVSYAFER
jgi:hypothetical protein